MAAEVAAPAVISALIKLTLTFPGLSAPKVSWVTDFTHCADTRRIGLARHATGDERQPEGQRYRDSTLPDGHAEVRVPDAECEKNIVVTPNVPIVRYVIGDMSAVKPGVAFAVVAAVKQPDGSFNINRINVGKDGAVPR